MVLISRVLSAGTNLTKSKIVPMLDRVLIEKLQPETKTKGGIMLPERAQKGSFVQGTVVAVGEGARNYKGELIPMTIEVGDSVILPDGDCYKMEFEKKDFFMYRETDIIAKIS